MPPSGMGVVVFPQSFFLSEADGVDAQASSELQGAMVLEEVAAEGGLGIYEHKFAGRVTGRRLSSVHCSTYSCNGAWFGNAEPCSGASCALPRSIREDHRLDSPALATAVGQRRTPHRSSWSRRLYATESKLPGEVAA